MHPAWQIYDIRALLFEHLDRQDLARLARTCRDLFEVMTDELWREITTMEAFLKCLPRDARRRRLRLDDLGRLNFYATKVEKVVLESKNIDVVIRLPKQFRIKVKYVNAKKERRRAKQNAYKGVDKVSEEQLDAGKSWDELWEEIAELRPPSTFLPNLRSLRINNVQEEVLLPLVGISGANLTDVYIKYIHMQHKRPERVVYQLLDQIKDTSKLEYLFVRDGEEDLLPTRLIKNAPLKHLRLDPRIHAHRHQDFQFKTLPLRPEILQKSALEHLTIGLTREWWTPEIEAQRKYLPRLKTLWLNLTTFKSEQCKESCINGEDGWTCERAGPRRYPIGNDASVSGPTDCGRRSPTVFLNGLDNPELKLLNIKFPLETTGPMFLDVVSAANSSCRLRNLTELALAGGGWFNTCGECGKRPAPLIIPKDLRAAMDALLPMPHLKVLRLSVAPNFLDILDLELYKKIADGIPNLETLHLGHAEFLAGSQFEGTTYYERTPLHHLAAFCSFLPKLSDVSLGAADGMTLEERPRLQFVCSQVRTLRVAHWAGDRLNRGVSRELLQRGVRTYFPGSDLARHEYSERYYVFEMG